MKQFKKIDIFTRRKFLNRLYVYEASTWQFRTCREAKEYFIRKHHLDETQVKCNFAKK